MNGVSRYSRDPTERRWQQQFDELQGRCQVDVYSPTIGELLDHSITRAQWRCRKWGTCWHESEPFALGGFRRSVLVDRLRRGFVCSACGTNRPMLHLLSG